MEVFTVHLLRPFSIYNLLLNRNISHCYQRGFGPSFCQDRDILTSAFCFIKHSSSYGEQSITKSSIISQKMMLKSPQCLSSSNQEEINIRLTSNFLCCSLITVSFCLFVSQVFSFLYDPWKIMFLISKVIFNDSITFNKIKWENLKKKKSEREE